MARSASRYGETGRRNLVLGILFVCALVLCARLFYLQVIKSQFLIARGDNRALRVQTEEALRGMILDREGEPLAISTPVSSVVVDPKVLWATLKGDFTREKEACLNDHAHSSYCSWIDLEQIDPEITRMRYEKERLSKLAELLAMKTRELIEALQKRAGRRFYYLKRQIAPGEVNAIMALGINGIQREDGYQRFYPAAELVGQIVGFTNIDEHGQEGIERQYENWLSGQPGKVRILQDRRHNAIHVVEEEVPAAPGAPLQLSVDKRIQFVIYKVLQDTFHTFQAKSVSAVMLDVKTGEVLGMLSLPAGNPNNLVERVPQLMKNRIVTDIFEPGSTIKPIAMAAALTAGVITPHTQFRTKGYLAIGHNLVRDTHDYGTLDTIGVLRKSSNVGMTMISQHMPRDNYYSFIKNMGFGVHSRIRFPGEQAGIVHDPKDLDDFSYATTFFGYGIATTALQIAHAYATIAVGGIKVPLTLLKRHNPPDGVRVMTQEIAREVLHMMKIAVEEGGTGMRANTGSYTVAGKTGTAHTISGGNYDKDRYRGLFAGVAPASDPRIALVVVVEDPESDAYYGGQVAAPAFAKIAESSLKILGVLPDKISQTDALDLKLEAHFSVPDKLSANRDESAR